MNILEIIKKVPEDHVYYSPLIGECHVDIIKCKDYPIIATRMNNEMSVCLSENGKYIIDSEIPEGECVLFPSRDNRDWEAFERLLDGVEMHHMLSQSFDSTPKIVWDDNTKKIIKMAEKWQREIEKIEKHRKEVEPMMREMAHRINEMYKEYQRRNNHDTKKD